MYRYTEANKQLKERKITLSAILTNDNDKLRFKFLIYFVMQYNNYANKIKIITQQYTYYFSKLRNNINKLK